MEENLIAWLASTGLAAYMRDTRFAWSWAETFHFIGLCMLFGSILVMDSRLLGFFRKSISLHAVHALTPWALVGFLLNLVTGVAFVARDAENYFPNPAFRLKMLFILLAGLNFLAFWFVIRKQLEKLSDDADVGFGAKFVGFSSIALWVLVIWTDRLIPVWGAG